MIPKQDDSTRHLVPFRKHVSVSKQDKMSDDGDDDGDDEED